LRLITIPMSHYCEKARWGLTHAGIAYTEEAHLQVFHYAAVHGYRAGGMVPVLIDGNTTVADSTEILRYLDRRLPATHKLYPASQLAEIESLEDTFDSHLGIETRRWVYFHWMSQPTRVVLQTAAQGVPRWQRLSAPLLFPMMRRYLVQHLAISKANVEIGLNTVNAVFDDVAARLGDGRRYLCGAQFTAADLSFACMAAPVLLPPEYGIRLPRLEQAPLAARADILRFSAHPAGQFALKLFAEHRGSSPI